MIQRANHDLIAQLGALGAAVVACPSDRPDDRDVLLCPPDALAIVPERLPTPDQRWAMVQCITEVLHQQRRVRRRRAATRRRHQPPAPSHRTFFRWQSTSYLAAQDLRQAIPLARLRQQLQAGLEYWEIAEREHLPPRVVHDAIAYWQRAGMLEVSGPAW